MEKAYQPKYIEQKWAKAWEERNYFAPSGKGPAYSIVIPPPNVTGSLHMGHGFQDTIMDVLTRYHRMQGNNTLWQVGTDHAGIATQMLVTQQLLAQGQDPYALPREEFVNKVWEWKEQSKNTISRQMRRIGISVDWSRERFTMDEGLSDAVQKVFIDLYNEGLIYRGKRLVNWDPVLNTAVSDLEVISEEQDGFLWHIKYPLDDDSGFLVIATTRPETMLGDTAVAVHPDDERYQHLIGKNIHLPLTERIIPIIADTYVEKDFGTGCVKITPAHDFNDYAMGQRHELPMINILNPDATINDNAPEEYRNLDRFVARKKIVEDLKKAQLLDKIENHKLKVPKGDRTNAIIEPLLTDQWFVKVAPLAKPAIEAVESGKIKFTPASWTKIYLQWLNNIQDWCISRQLIWGHRIPAWYDEDEKFYVGNSEAEIREQHKLPATTKLTQDDDVLDTWFSSALWPFSSLGWPEETPDLKAFYPTSVLVTGFDIIFFWVVRMVMMGLKFTGEVPFHEVYITGLIRDGEGQKMSKSKGNILDPIDLVDGITLEDLIKKRTINMMQPQLAEKIAKATKKEFPDGIKAHGMDALRFTFCALASTGRDINFDLNRLDGYRNFCNKIWNAARFVLMNADKNSFTPDAPLTIADRWIRDRLQHTIKEIAKQIKIYRFDLVAQTIYEFIWHEYCDWYLELYKVNPGKSNTIVTILEATLRLIHPLMPFISEEIWQQIAPLAGINGDSIMPQPYPEFDQKALDNEAAQDIEWLKRVIMGIRNIRSEMNIAPGKKLPLIFNKGNKEDLKRIAAHQEYIIKIAKIESLQLHDDKDEIPQAATALVDKLEIHIPIANIIDIAAEKQRLEKEIGKLAAEIARSENKLANINYVKKAPKNVVELERNRLDEHKSAANKLKEQLTNIGG